VEGSLVLCDVVLAEVASTLVPADMPQFLSDWNLTFVPSSLSSAILAGEMFRIYLQRGGNVGGLCQTFWWPHTPRLSPNASLPVIVAIIGITSRN
jgi:hypothetical protein